MEFYYKSDPNGGILAVSNYLPERPPTPNITDEQWAAELASWHSADIADYSPVWDEAKRCPMDAKGVPRFISLAGDIQPNPDASPLPVVPESVQPPTTEERLAATEAAIAALMGV